MALRAVLNRAKPWAVARRRHHQLFKANQLDVLMQLAVSNPSLPIISYFTAAAAAAAAVCIPTTIIEALASAQFAVSEHNETRDGNIRFERVVRASRLVAVHGYDYYLTFEGTDENGVLNVYYAEVCDSPSKKCLRHWQLVDDSFSYPFRKLSADMNKKKGYYISHHDPRHFLRVFLPTVSLRYKDDASPMTSEESQRGLSLENPDPARKTMNSEESIQNVPDSSSSSSDDHIDPTDVVPVYNMIHCGKVAYYAASAVEIYREKMGQKLCLAEVLHASKEYIDGKLVYILMLKAINDRREYRFLHAMLEVSELKKEESIKWHVVEELFSGPPGKK
ncbi:OLC1v1003914C1 [Oldenlandia corymbosa var. corymbosa]|uniref:Cysteine proteinase inhibitor n=1 Tax=Oldenlandia corymbosa var. corymbosa TaxID=529605 RepID=A0AAV1DBA9_OLDCO|nr:OLC1v1003914C1 [Oldenlandia corymbosa var. corymbosa]